MAKIVCTTCDTPIRVSEEMYGRRIRCEECGAVFRVDDDLLDDADRRAPAGGKKRRRKKSAQSLAALPWIFAGVMVGLVALVGGGVGLVLLVRAAPSFSFPKASSWVTVSLPEGLSFSSPGELMALPRSPLPNSKAYGYESKNGIVCVMTMSMPPGLGSNANEIMSKFESNLRQGDPKAKMKRVQVDGQQVLEVEKMDPANRFCGWVRMAVVENELIALIVANDVKNSSTRLRDQVFRSMRLPGRSLTAVAGVTTSPVPGTAAGDPFSRLNSFFGGQHTAPTVQMPGAMAGPAAMPAMPAQPPSDIAGGTVGAPPGAMPNLPGAPPGFPTGPRFPVGPSFPGRPGFGPPVRPGMNPGAIPPGVGPAGAARPPGT